MNYKKENRIIMHFSLNGYRIKAAATVKRGKNAEIRRIEEFISAIDETERQNIFRRIKTSSVKIQISAIMAATQDSCGFFAAYLKRNIHRATAFLADNYENELLGKIISSGFATKRNIDSLLQYAIYSGNIRAYIMLYNYDAEFLHKGRDIISYYE